MSTDAGGAAPGLARAFVAVVPPPEVLDAVERVVARARTGAPAGLRWSGRAQWHLTLQFLGRVIDRDALVDALEAGLSSSPPVPLRLGSAGAFPNASRASVVWLGVDRGGDGLAALAASVRAATAPLGYEDEARPFTPHLTVARARRPESVASLLAGLGDGPVGPEWEAGEVVVMDSDTRPDGAVHREVAMFPLRLGRGRRPVE